MTFASFVGFVVAAFVVAFAIAYFYELHKAKKRFRARGIPVSQSRLLKDAFLFACVVGCIFAIVGGKTAAQQNQYQDIESGAPPPMNGQQIPMPMPSYSPQMNWTPMQSAAQDGVQG